MAFQIGNEIQTLIKKWHPRALIVGLPMKINEEPQYTTELAQQFAKQLESHYMLPVHLVDERLTTKEARALLFELGGYQNIKKNAVDSIAACIILEQWLKSVHK